MGEEKRQEMMQNLFGESDEEVESDQEAVRHSSYLSDEEGEGEVEGEGQADIEGEGEAEVESEGERAYSEPEKEESEGERYRSSPEREISDQRMESDGKEAESDAEEYDRREATSKRHSVSPSISERSAEHNGLEDGDEEVEQVREPSEQGDDENVVHPAANMHDVFGESDDEEQPDYAGQHSPERSVDRAPSEDEGSEQRVLHPEDIVPEDMVPEEEQQYESEEEQQFDQKHKEKPVGPPLSLEIPLRPPPGQPEKMNIVRVSNIMEIDTKPFDPKTYVEEDVFVTDESGGRNRIRLGDNVVRWREVRNRDGTITRESNARFVRWSDGSLQLLIGNEVLDISVQNARHDHVHLFLRHDKGILQSQGRLQHKMRFRPSSLSSKSHKMLTALVDSRHKKQYKVKNVITNTDPEREKEEKEKALEQRIRSREDLHRKQEKISRKYAPVREREPQLSPGYLEEALEEDDEEGYVGNRRAVHARRFQEELEAEGRAERRIINAKKHQPPSREQLPKYSKDRRPIRPSRREAEEAMSDESEREASEYESEGLEDEEENIQEDLEEQEAEEEEPEEPEEEEQEAQEDEGGESEEEERAGDKRRRQEKEEYPLEESPPRKPAQRRRVVVSSESDED